MRKQEAVLSEEVRGKSEKVSSLLVLFFSLLALPSSLLALPSPLSDPPSPLKLLENGLRFDGSQWIATGYCPAAGDWFECEIKVDDKQPNATAAVFGTVREQEPERTFAFYVRQDGDDSTVVVYGGTARGGFFTRDKEVSLSVVPDGASWVWEGGSERLALAPGDVRNGMTPLMIGDANAASLVGDSFPAGTGTAMTLYRFRIWRGGLELIHDYVPCSNTETGVAGVFDLCGEEGENRFRGLNMLSDIPYRTWDRERSAAVECVCPNAFLVLPDTTVLKGDQWYFVKDEISCGSITVEGSAHLIVGVGAKMTASDISGGTLAVYGQSQGVGKLTVAGEVTAALTVEGGFISAGTLSGDKFAVVGGTVTAANVQNGKVTIDGGSVKAAIAKGLAKNSTPTNVYCVTVRLSEEGRAGSWEGRAGRLTLEGLSGYGTNDIYSIGDCVYLWLPDGMHRFTVSDGETTNRYFAVVNGSDITIEPGVPVTPGVLSKPFATAETATNAIWAAYIRPRDDVAAALGAGTLLGAYRQMFGFAVTGEGTAWSLKAVLTPVAWTNVVLSAQGATWQIPVAAIARLPVATTNVTVAGCCVPGFYYSLYDGWALTNIVADANAANLNVLCGADKGVKFSGVKKPSVASGFFSVGVSEFPGVKPSDRLPRRR